MDIFNNKSIENLELTLAQLINVVNEQTIELQALRQQDMNRVVFRGFGFKEE